MVRGSGLISRKGGGLMRVETIRCFDREFLSITGEAGNLEDPEAEADALFLQFTQVLEAYGLSLENTIRSRIWAADGEARTACSEARSRTLKGLARAATSSYIAPAHLTKGGRVAMDLIAICPSGNKAKVVIEQKPPQGVIKWLTVGELLVLPGMSCNDGGSFESQAEDILGRITTCLANAGSRWSDVVEITFVCQSGIQQQDIFLAFHKETKEVPLRMVLLPAEGYSRPGKFLEIEVMAIKLS